MDTIRVGILGAGGMGTRHATNLYRHVVGAKVTALYDPDVERARQAAAQSGAPSLFDDPLQLIANDKVDALVIASPDQTHVDFVLEALRCQKPVLCEKPLATTAADALTVVQAEATLRRRLVSVGFMRRFDPPHLALGRAAASGNLGRPIVYKGVHRNATVPYHATGEVVLTNSASHDIDATRWLLGQEVEEVYVRGVRTRPTFSPDTRDLLLIQMALTGGCLAMIEIFVAAGYGYEVSAEIVAERGTALTAQPSNVVVRSHETRFQPVPLNWLDRFQEAYVDELNRWLWSIRSQQAFSGGSTWDGYLALIVVEACIQSLQTGAPVAVPAPPRPALYGGGAG